MRGCGLKWFRLEWPVHLLPVILYARMWIEIWVGWPFLMFHVVILYARMWIEIRVTPTIFPQTSVILCAGMWIEIPWLLFLCRWRMGHPLCGDVDWNALSISSNVSTLMSSSVRGCGLKSLRRRHQRVHGASSSMWGCGLKSMNRLILIDCLTSSSVWGWGRFVDYFRIKSIQKDIRLSGFNNLC